MHRTRTLALVAVTAVATLVASSCGVLADTDAATVVGRTVSIESVEQLSRDEGFTGAMDADVQEGSVPGDLFRSVLQFELQRVAWIAEADRWGIEITEEMRDAAAQQVEAQITSTGTAYDDETREKLVEYVAAQTALETRFAELDPSADADLRLLYEGAPSLWERICVAVVQVDPAQVDAAERALHDGASVEELPGLVEGTTLAADPEQCVPGSELPDELESAFRAAPRGSDEGPLSVGDPATGAATYLYRVDERRTIGFGEAREELAQIAQGLAQQGAQTWISLVVSEAEIDPRFGTGVSRVNGQPVVDAPPAPLPEQLDLGGMLGTEPEAVPQDDGHDHDH
jgi:hypothetical protein